MNGFEKIEEGLNGDNELLREGIKDIKSLIVSTKNKEKWKKKPYSQEAIIEGLFQGSFFNVDRRIGCFDDSQNHNECKNKDIDQFLNTLNLSYLNNLREFTGIEACEEESPYSSSLKSSNPTQVKFRKAAYFVIEEFCDYLISLKQPVQENSELIREFIDDIFSAFGPFDNRFRISCQVQSPAIQITTLERLFNDDSICAEGITNNLLIVFGLRQSLEIKFRKILGVASIENVQRIPHDCFPDFIRKNFPPDSIKNIRDIELIMKIYKWTNCSIHSMWRVPSWMLWKAIDFCRYFLESDYEKIKIDYDCFYKIQKKFADHLSKTYKKPIKVVFTVHPDVLLTNCPTDLHTPFSLLYYSITGNCCNLSQLPKR